MVTTTNLTNLNDFAIVNDDAVFLQLLSANGTGSGAYDSFLRIFSQGDSTEYGFNTDERPLNPPEHGPNAGPHVNDANNSSVFTHSIQLSAVPVYTNKDFGNGEKDYLVFRLDIGESNSGNNSLISLDEFKIYQGSNPSPASGPTGTVVYDLDAAGDKSLMLNDLSHGNGQSDYLIYVPVSDFTAGGADSYLTLYAKFSGADSTFEEFGVAPADGGDGGGGGDDGGGGGGGTPNLAIEKVTYDATTGIVDVATDGTNVAAHFASGTDGAFIAVGDDVTWIYKVTNSGTAAASTVAVTDNLAGTATLLAGDTHNPGQLDTDETWYYAINGTAAAGQYANIGSVTAAGVTPDANDSDASSYFGAVGGISIDKVTVDTNTDTNTEAAGDNLVILAGEAITWRYTVKNEGTVSLHDVSVTDTDGQANLTMNLITVDANGLLDVGETWTYEATGTAVASTLDPVWSYTNTGSAQGTWNEGIQVAGIGSGFAHTPGDENDSGYFGADPQVSIDKTTISSHNQGDGINVIAGEDITWHYEVTNTGNVALNAADVTVTDDHLGVIPLWDGVDTGVSGMLDVGETWVYEAATGTAVMGGYTNTGTATGSFTDTVGHTGTDTDTNDSSYTGHGLATLGLSKGYWANHGSTFHGGDQWDGASNPNLVIGDGDPNGGTTDFSIDKGGAELAMNTNTTGDARLIFIGQAEAAQLNAYAAGVTANGLLDSAADWLNANAGQDDNNVLASEWSQPKKNSFSFNEGDKVTTSSPAWHDDFFNGYTYSSNEDGGNEHVVSVSGEGLKNILEAYDLASGGNGLVVSDDGSLVGWLSGGVVSHVYDNNPLAFIAVANEAVADGIVNLAGVADADQTYHY